MTKFQIGDKVQMLGIPISVEVLEFGICDEQDCELDSEIFRFEDPVGLGEDWDHSANFEKI